jgi:fucokinase
LDLRPETLFALREAIARAGEAFAEFRSGTGAGAASPPWDAVVLTCATESQAAAAHEELARRRAVGLFPPGCLLLALADPPRGRVGSGGATFLALEALAARWGDLGARRVLLIHSGGESQRLPAYAVLGKIFAPLPVLLPQAPGSAIFDWLYLLASALPGERGEVTLLAGDVLPVFDPVRLPPLATTRFAVRGVGLPVPAAVGQRFGVYVPDRDGEARRILQKPSLAELAAAGVLDPATGDSGGRGVRGGPGPAGQVVVDTGIVTLGPEAVGALRVGLARRRGRASPGARGAAPVTWDLYRDWLPLLGREAGPGRTDALGRALAEASRGLRAGVAVPPEGLFVHLGTTRDFHDAVVGNTPLRRLFPFTSQRESAVESGAEVAGAFAGRSLLSRLTRLGRGAVVDHCRADGVLDVGADGMASGVEVPPGEILAVDPGRLCYQTLLGQERAGRSRGRGEAGDPAGARRRGRGRAVERVTVVLGLDDNPKLGLDDPEATLNGQPLGEWLASRDLTTEDVWPPAAGPAGPAGSPGTRQLWEAKLFVPDAADPYRRILRWLQRPRAQGPSDGSEGLAALGLPGVRERWLGARRVSLRDLLEGSDAAALAAWRGALVGDIAAARVVGDVGAGGDEDFSPLFSALTPSQRGAARRRLEAIAAGPPATAGPLHRARYWRVLADLAPPGAAPACLDRATAAVREAVSRTPGGALGGPPGGTPGGALQDGRAGPAAGGVVRVPPGGRVRVAAPVRIDFGGGWTDTPPFSLERGGAVVNAAVALDGELPIWAEVEVTPSPGIVLESEDIGATVAVATRADVAGYCQPNDPFALLKACLVLTGVLDPEAEDPLAGPASGAARGARWRAAGPRSGWGLRVRTGCRIPRGSGLGTSSILGAAVLRALGEALGCPQDDAELSRQTLELEQLMTTGGGWQDQMGAIAPGIKLVTTEPGPEQRPRVDVLALSPEARATLEAHLVVAYTGHHRLAKNILREVVTRYLGRDPLAMQALYQLRGVAEQLAGALGLPRHRPPGPRPAGGALDLERFGTLVNQAWLLNKTLDPQASYPAIERLFSALAPHVYGAKLVGAGGGGFLVAVTRRPEGGELVADLMARDREFAYGYVVPHRLWDDGLRVSHLPGASG